MAAPLLVFADDWGRHPSSCQHLIRQLLSRRRVLWVNTIGTRKPRLDRATFQRGFEKLRQWSRPAPPREPLPPNLAIANPRMWPWFSRRHDRALNRRLLIRALSSRLGQMPEPPIAVTTLPLVADLVGSLSVRRWVYYCVDDFSVWPGLDGQTLRQMEERLIAHVDRIVAVSETLRDRIQSLGRTAELLTHGVDLDFWRGGGSDWPELATVPQPLIVFWGVIDRRMDVEFVRRLSATGFGGSLVFVGPQDQPDPELARLRGVILMPPAPIERLPGLAKRAAVLVMPYADLPVTRAMQPLKLKEYLATGRPVVVRDLPATRPWADCLDLVQAPDSFVAAVTRRLAEGIPPSQQQARARLAAESWQAKADAFEQWLDQETVTDHGPHVT